MNLTALLARWATDKGKPFKGDLIDWETYLADPSDLGCMSAQGQLLFEAGWKPTQLKRMDQAGGDLAVAKLLNISRAHAILLRHVNWQIDGDPSVVLTDPGKVMGDQWSKVLDFWWALHSLTPEDWDAVSNSVNISIERNIQLRENATNAAINAADAVVGERKRSFVGDITRHASRTAEWYAARATYEIQGADILRRDGNRFFYLPTFGFSSPDDIPPRPDNYGTPA